MSKVYPVLKFLILLSIVLGIVFVTHITLLENSGFPKYGDKIVLSYIVNGILAAFIYGLLFVFKSKLKNYIGFLFMAGSFLKFIFFFLLFYPAFQEDGTMNKLEFAAFFFPYAICLVVETIFIAKMLKKLY